MTTGLARATSPGRPTIGRLARTAWISTVALGLLLLAPAAMFTGLAVGAFPSDPAPVPDRGTEATYPVIDTANLWPGLALVATSAVLFLIAMAGYRRAQRDRARLQFAEPPGWPPAPPKFMPTPGWTPPKTWPDPTNGWHYWHWPPDQRFIILRPPPKRHLQTTRSI